MATNNISIELLAGLADEGGKKRTNCAPYLRSFVESGEPYLIVDMTLFPDFKPEQMVQHFKNAGKATHHNAVTDAPEYDIPGAYHVLPKYVKSENKLYLLNQPVITRLIQEEAERVTAEAVAAAK